MNQEKGGERNRWIVFFLFLLVTLANYNVYIGFALKPYMVFSILYLIVCIGVFRFVRFHLFEVAMVVFYLMYSLSGAFSIYPESSLRILVGIIIYLFCYLVMKSIIGQASERVILKSISMVGIFFNAMSLLLYFIGLKTVGFVLQGDRVYQYGLMLDRDYPRLIGLLQDPNFFVFYNTLFFAFYLTNAKGWMNKIGLLLVVVTNLLTFSRGGLMVMIALFLLYMILNHPMKQLKMIIALTLSVTLGAYISIVYFKFQIFDILTSRMKDFTEDGGSGRLDLWGRAWNYFTEHPFFGIGAFNFSDYNWHEYQDTLTVHNTYLDILSESGLLGIFCYLLFILLVLYQLIEYKVYKKRPYLFLTFVGLVLQMGFLSVIINDMFFLYLAVLSTYMTKQEQGIQAHNSSVRVHVHKQVKGGTI